MTLDPNDPRLTAYALGALDPAARAEVEALLAEDPAARAEVEALQALAGDLEGALASEGQEEALQPLRHVRIHRARRRHLAGTHGPLWPVLLSAAVLLLAVAPLVLLLGLPGFGGGGGHGFMSDVTEEETASLDGRSSAPEATEASDAEDAWRNFDVEISGARAAPGTTPRIRLVRPYGEPGGGVVANGWTLFDRDGVPVPAHLQPTGFAGGESYVHPGVDPFHRVSAQGGHTSTFGVDVDTASYSNLRRMLREGQRPPPAAVRIEEIVNAFDYAYEPPAEGAEVPFTTHVAFATCPWNPRHRLARVAIKAREIRRERRPAANLVFLVDVSGSMEGEDKLPLVRTSLEMLVEQLRDDDRVAIVTYASSASRVLASTPGSEREAILGAVRALKAGGSTNGAGGIQMAYEEAARGFREGGVNRVLLCTDGDFNVGVSDTGGLVRLIEEKARSGVFLSVLGYGTGNYKDDKMEAISNRGNGTYAYVDGQDEARRVLVEQMSGTLVTVAKDVKFQLWFNPRTVAAWRLLGYENRRLAAQDFNDDRKDAGDVGAGHEVTALYEIVPVGAEVPGRVDPNPFVRKPGDGEVVELHSEDPAPDAKAVFIWRLRWKAPEATASTLLERNAFDDGATFEHADRDLQWAAGAAAFGMLLRRSPHLGEATWSLVEELVRPAVGDDPRRAEFLDLVEKARALDGQ